MKFHSSYRAEYVKKEDNPQNIDFTGEAKKWPNSRMLYPLRGRMFATYLGYSVKCHRLCIKQNH